MQLGALDFGRLRVGLNLLDDGVDLLHLQVDDVVHDALCLGGVLAQEPEVERCVVGERVADVAV